jgi:hypothetical protein
MVPGQVVIRRQLKRRYVLGFLSEAAALSRRYRTDDAIAPGHRARKNVQLTETAGPAICRTEPCTRDEGEERHEYRAE